MSDCLLPSLRIVIVNWNAGAQLRACLESVASAQSPGFVLEQIVVVDNHSTDRSLDGLDTLALPLTVIVNPQNRGFGAACNQGARGAAADYLLFLNPDVRVFADSLNAPIRFLEQPENARVGTAGIRLVDENGSIHRSCARFPTPAMFLARMLGLDQMLPRTVRSHIMAEWDHDEDRDVDHVIGAFMLTRRSLFEALGGFDERFFVYLEDLDLSLRLHQAGWRTVFLADVEAFHKGGGTSDLIKAIRLSYSLHSRLLYAEKHFRRRSAALLRLATLTLEPLVRLSRAALRRSTAQGREVIEGYRLLRRTLAAQADRGSR